MKYYSVVLISFLFSSCIRDTNADSTFIGLKPIWYCPTTDDGKVANSATIRASVFIDNSIIVGGRSNGTNALYKLNSSNGAVNWIWRDYPTNSGLGSTDLYFPFTYNGYLVSQCSYYNFCINLDDGKTKWENVSNSGFDIFNCFYPNTLYTGVQGINNKNNKAPGVYTVDLSTGKQDLFLPVRIDTTGVLSNINYSGEASFVYSFINNQDTLLSIIVTDPPLSGYKFRLTTSLYNKSKGVWVNERIPLLDASNSGVNGKPVVIDSNMYVCSGGVLTRFNMLTGQQGWVQNFNDGGVPSGFLTSTPFLAGGKIFIQNENTYMYCIEPNSGQIIWKQGNFGTASHMEYLNGVVYFVCGGDGKLYAIDAANGNKLWAITSPDYAKNSGATFDRYVGLVPPQNGAKGKIVVTTGLNAYCYEAYK